jgi:spore coat protein CotH
MKLLHFMLCCCLCHWAWAQDAIFPNNGTLYDKKLHKIELLMHPDSLEALYDIDNRWTNHSYPATFIYDDKDTLYQVGVRIKGNTSRYSKRLSLKIDIDEYKKQTYQGLKTFNINGNHNDPSLCREFMSAYLMNEAGVVSLRANWVKLYINGVYRGLFDHAEQINKKFLESRFGNDTGNLYKCSYPADLKWLGGNQQTYKDLVSGPLKERIYELKTNEKADDYSDLVQLINVINNTSDTDFPTAIEAIFDVQAYLKVLAMEVLIGHWDSYWFNHNNYYLYHNPSTGKFVYLPYDMDNTWGVQWGIPDVNVRSIQQWGNTAAGKAPLANRIMKHAAYRKAYEQYIFEAINSVFNEDYLFPKIDAWKAAIADAIASDPFFTGKVPSDYGYDVQDWENSFTKSINDGHTSFGIKQYVSDRRASAITQFVLSTEPNRPALLFYPNPAKGWLHIVVSAPEVWMSIHSLDGRISQTHLLTAGTNAIQLQGLAKGIYLLRFKTDKGEYSKTMMIE